MADHKTDGFISAVKFLFTTERLQAGLFALAVFFPVFFFSSRILDGSLPPAYPFFWAVFISALGYLIFSTGRISPRRTVLFVSLAAGFLIHFKSGLVTIGEQTFSTECMQDVPYCHIAMASTVLNYLYQQYLALMSGDWKLWGPLTIAVLWLGVTLVPGRGWCSWVCFYGGIDEGFSKMLRKPILRPERLPAWTRDFPMALLIFLLLISLAYLMPIFCLWVCPLKITTEFLEPSGDPVRSVQLTLMSVAGFLFLIILPVLTGKRTFCSYICPFGAWQSVAGKINPFRVTIDARNCTECKSCYSSCPMMAIRCTDNPEDASPDKPVSGRPAPEILNYCNMCGKCTDVCPENSARYTILGRDLSTAVSGWGRFRTVKNLYVFSALVVSGTFGSIFVPAAVSDIVNWISR
ncbi:MAG: 4Fe-4S binding protein [bacterium]